jgi:hypothetical protein
MPCKSILLFCLLIAFVSVSCGSDETTVALFYPVDSLLDNQVRQLTRSRATLSKIARMGQEESAAEYIPADTTGWQKELEVFYQINAINKPVNKSSYSIENRRDESTGLQLKTFYSSEEVPVRMLKVYFRDTPLLPDMIEASVTEVNSMFKGTRNLQLKFAQENDNIVLTGYTIDGGQKMFLADSVRYNIKGSVTISRN